MRSTHLEVKVTTRRRRFWLARPLCLLALIGFKRQAWAIAERFVRVDAYIAGQRIISVPFRRPS